MFHATKPDEKIISEAFLSLKSVFGILQAKQTSQKGRAVMTKTLDLITEVIRTPKNAFRQAGDRPTKTQKHRYERRKIREFIKLGDWSDDTA